MTSKKLFLLFGSGVAALVGGAVSFYVEQELGPVSSALCLGGTALLAAGAFLRGRMSRRNVEFRQWKKAAGILLAVVLSACFFGGINYAALKSSWRWDVTRAKQHTLTPGTTALIKSLTQAVQFTALYVGIPPAYLEDLFKEYARASNGKITAEIIDPIEQIGYAAQFGNVIDGGKSKVVVRSGRERRDVDFTGDSLSEEQLTDAVMRVTRRERRICFLTGHGEFSMTDKGDQGLTTLAQSLAVNNMTCREVMLGIEESVPQECDVLIVPGPRNDLTLKEEAKIDQYLKQGGDALFLVENLVVTTPDQPLKEEDLHKNPSLNRILNQWGVNVNDDLAVDLSSHAGDDVGCPATRNYVEHEAITVGLDYTFYIRPRSITALKERRPSIRLAPVVMTMSGDKSWAETDRTLQVVFDPLLDTPGPVTMGFVLMEKKKEGVPSDTRVIVFTDADFLTNLYIGQYSNARMGLNVINWLAEADPGVLVETKKVKVERLDLTSKQRRQVAAALFLMPLVIAFAGCVVWQRRG